MGKIIFLLFVACGELCAQYYGQIIDNTNPCLPKSYNYQEYLFQELDFEVNCSAATNPTAKIEDVFFAQTHVMEPDWPLFFLIAHRPALLQVGVTGSGAAPQVAVAGWVNGVSIGTMCLKGPATLPASVNKHVHGFNDRFTITLPKTWMVPGLSIAVLAGESSRNFTEEQLNVMYSPEINLLMLQIDALNYNDGAVDEVPREEFLPELASEMPAGIVRFGNFPDRIKMPTMAIGGPSPNGAGVPPLILDKRLCRNNESPGPECFESSTVTMGDINGAASRMIGAINKATGDYSHSVLYGNTGQLNPGGWGGGKSFVGIGFTNVMLHEMGHALSLPHWGGSYNVNDPGNSQYSYPYGGITLDGGGRGDTWNFYQSHNLHISPGCLDENKDTFLQERSDGMQRTHQCNIMYATGRGPWDGFSDFSAIAMFRYLIGAETVKSGSVPYARTGQASYHLKSQGGFPTMKLNENGACELIRDGAVTQKQDWERFDILTPNEQNVPVFTVYGSYHPQYPTANIIYEPMAYLGNLPKVIDPTDPATFEEITKSRSEGIYEDFFWSHKDLTFKFIYDDNTVSHALYVHGNVSRTWELGSGIWRRDLLYWAFNISGTKGLKRIEMYHRPFTVRNSNSTDEGNAGNPSFSITAENFMDAATFVAGIDMDIPPVGIEKKTPDNNLFNINIRLGNRNNDHKTFLTGIHKAKLLDLKGKVLQEVSVLGSEVFFTKGGAVTIKQGIYVISLIGKSGTQLIKVHVN